MHEVIQSMFSFLTSLGYVGIALALMVEVIPSEIVLAYAGYLVARGMSHLLGPWQLGQ